MTELLTAAQMREIEQAAIASGSVTGLELMELAGRGVVDAVFEEWPELAKTPHRAVVLCGPGNNGGDGFVVARLLKEAGWEVEVFLYGDAEKLPPDAEVNYEIWCKADKVSPLIFAKVLGAVRPDLIVDAVFGIGLSRPLPDDVTQSLNRGRKTIWKKQHQIKTVAVDCPSGLDLDTGMIPTDVDVNDPDADPWPSTLNFADLTVTFHSPKVGHYLGLGPQFCGKLRVIDIGLDPRGRDRSMLGQTPDPERTCLIEPVFAGRPLPAHIWPLSHLSKYRGQGHKFDHGHVVAFVGGAGRGGAGRLAARAALRVGAGVVTVVCPPDALAENACQLSAIMLRALPEGAALDTVVDRRASSFCIGPGLGIGAQTRDLVGQVLRRRAGDDDWRDPAVVIDADALGAFADDPSVLFAQTHARTILTPHEGEFERLFPDLALSQRAARSKVDVVRAAAERAGCVVLLKGVDTVIACPGGGASVHSATGPREVPWLATAGAGDVLAGMIAGLAAGSATGGVFNLAEVAVWLHVECARSFGPGLIAEDLPEELPKVFRALGV